MVAVRRWRQLQALCDNLRVRMRNVDSEPWVVAVARLGGPKAEEAAYDAHWTRLHDLFLRVWRRAARIADRATVCLYAHHDPQVWPHNASPVLRCWGDGDERVCGKKRALQGWWDHAYGGVCAAQALGHGDTPHG